MKDDRILLQFILDAIDRILRYSEMGEEEFYADEKTQDAILRNFQTMGNAAVDLSDGFRSSHPEIEWSDIIGFRNVIVHDYLGVDLPTVWSIIDQEVKPLREKIAHLI